MPRLTGEQLAGFRKQSQPPTPATPAAEEPTSTNGHTTPSPAPTQPAQTARTDQQPRPRRTRPSPAATTDEPPSQNSSEQPRTGKAALWLPKPTANHLRAVSQATGYPLSRLVTAAIIDAADTLAEELDGGVPLLRRRPDPGREVFTLWLSATTKATLKDLARAGGISASEVAARALGPFLDRLEAEPTYAEHTTAVQAR
jgi:hypothetical protein